MAGRSKYTRYSAYDYVRQPTFSEGSCLNVRNCKAYTVELADGWCMRCWDKGLNRNSVLNQSIQRRQVKEQVKIAKQLAKDNKKPEQRGRHKNGCKCDIHRPYTN